MSVVVFLGPSCPRDAAAAVLDADYRAAAAVGDVQRAADEGATTIVLIDGLMVYGYPPTPMEVHDVAQRGVSVHGAASIGALRAVELRNHGVEGSGWVYGEYLSGRVTADDELLALVDPATQRPVTVPLVRIRYALQRLSDRGAISAEQLAAILCRLRNTYFERRTVESIYEAAAAAGVIPSVAELLLSDEYDIKAQDTLACLHHVRRLQA